MSPRTGRCVPFNGDHRPLQQIGKALADADEPILAEVERLQILGSRRRSDELARFVRCVRWLAEVRTDPGHIVHHAPIQHLQRDWLPCRAARRLVDERIAAFRTLPSEEQLGFVHPASPQKPPGWTIEK